LKEKNVKLEETTYNDLDETWLKTGEGEMICEPRNSRLGKYGKESETTEQANGSSAFSASPTSLDKLIDQMFTNGVTMSKLVEQIGVAHQLIATSQQHLSKAQEETDRIISLLELEKGSKAELEKALRNALNK
jgi:hypothetical protein